MKKLFIDLDNTLCKTTESDYINSTPIPDRINMVNKLKADGNHITIWTARGARSKIDHSELTRSQLKEWGVNYDELLLQKPDYDMYLDDKSFNIDAYFPVPVSHYHADTDTDSSNIVSKKEPFEIVEKGWGKEIIFVNNPEYCGKILVFNAGKKFSMHYHVLKKETWYVAKGRFILIWIETKTGTAYSEYLEKGDVITNERGAPHQLYALEDSEIFEVSTRHYDEDSFRIKKGD